MEGEGQREDGTSYLSPSHILHTDKETLYARLMQALKTYHFPLMFHLLVINGGATHTESELVSSGMLCPSSVCVSLCKAGGTNDIPDF